MESLRLFVLSLVIYVSRAQVSIFDCPQGWEDYDQYCYKLSAYPVLTYAEAHAQCNYDGAFLLTVNTNGEHMFVVDKLDIYDIGLTKRTWWTSGKRLVAQELEFFWEGDGSKIESYFYWLDDAVLDDSTKNIILYHYDGYKWGWILGGESELHPFICKISKDDIYRIQQNERKKDFGFPTTDESEVPFGPIFVGQPTDVVYEPNIDTGIVLDQTSMECRANANPIPDYRWFKIRAGETVEIETVLDSRYTIIGGKLLISRPSQERADDGSYECWAHNEFGTIVSNTVQLYFGFLMPFPKSPRSGIRVVAYTYTSMECNPPKHFPAVLFSWYKNSPSNYIQTELKPYIFISNNGRLYFSEVTTDDVGDYYCVVTRTGSRGSSGETSMPTKLNVVEGSPGTYEPKIPDEFPYVYPENPKVGDNIRMECWASGTSRPQLQYFWRKVILTPSGAMERELPLPNQAYLSDHNRVLNIPNVTLYDQGNYTCSVARQFIGKTDTKNKQLLLQAEPYFMLPLKSQYMDLGSDLTWRCDASGNPQPAYTWYRNAELLDSLITDEDRVNGRVVIANNVLTIQSLDPEKDNGMYQCAAANIHAVRYSSAELKVLAFAPTFTKSPLLDNQFATNGGNTTILCRVEAAPFPEITWYKNGMQVTDSDRVQALPSGNMYISPVQANDAGNYTCQAVNDYGEAASSGKLTVLKTVTISRVPENENIPVNQSRFLHCSASYAPQMDVTYRWYHSDVIIEFERVYRLGENNYMVWENPHYQRGTGFNHGGLLIQRAEQEHQGQYLCVVESTMGDQFQRSAEVNIVGPPWPPAGMDVRTYDTTSATFRWKAGGNNGATIRSYVIEALNHWEQFWRIIQTNVNLSPDASGTIQMTVNGLRPYSIYQLRVRAENLYGTSDPSEPSGEFETESVKPDTFPLHIGGGGGKVGTLQITWQPLDEWEENGRGFGYRLLWRQYGEPEFDDKVTITIEGNVGRHVMLVGETNFYTLYEVALQAFNDLGRGPMSDVVRIRSAMGLPKALATNVRAQPYNATACRVTWEPVPDSRDDMKGQLGGYKVAFWPEEWGKDYENPDRVTYNGQRSEGMAIGLEPNRQYYFAVYVWNEAGNGPKSQWFLQRTLRNAPINQPVEVKVFRKSSTSIRVYWRGVSTTYLEEPLEGYKVRVWREREDIKLAQDYNAAKETDLYISGLHPDNHYKLRVFGYSRGGDGTMSSPAITFMLGAASAAQTSILSLVFPICLALWYLLQGSSRPPY